MTTGRINAASGAKRTRPVFTVAAETIAAVSGVAETVIDFVHGRALRHYQEGLRQYLALRLCDVEAASRALLELRASVAASPTDELLRPPGVRAQLYRRARELALRTGPLAPDRTGLPFRPPRSASLDDEAVVSALRFELPSDVQELLELRYARELSLEETAFVLGLGDEDARSAERAAEQAARARLGEIAAGDELAHLVVSAFALERIAEDKTSLDEHPPLPSGTVVGGRYSLLGRVGSGAFGDVYSAQDTEVPGHRVALKLLHQAALSDAARSTGLRELHLIASVFHPSVVQFKDHGWYEGRLWFVMPWYDGETLEARLQRRALTRAEARRIFEPLARALATMHAAGIRHQDVKPENIMLARIQGFGQKGDEEEVLPVLLDLGVAAKDAEMVIAGTPNYFAPEVAAQFASVADKAPVTSSSDVFSLALSLRNALEPETQEDVPAGAVERFIERRARTVPAMPKRRELRFLEPYFRRWMNLDPSLRPTADELAEELEVLTRPEERRARTISLLRWVVPLALAVGVVFLSVVYVLNERAERQELEAIRARLTATGLREDLHLSREQQKVLARDVESIRERYEKGQLSRQQLAQQLARAEGQLRMTRTRLAAAEATAADLDSRLVETTERLRGTSGELEGVRVELTRAQTLLAAEQERSSEAHEELARLRGELATAQRTIEQERRRLGDLDTQVALLRSQLTVEQSKVSRLEREATARAAEAPRSPRSRSSEAPVAVPPSPAPNEPSGL